MSFAEWLRGPDAGAPYPVLRHLTEANARLALDGDLAPTPLLHHGRTGRDLLANAFSEARLDANYAEAAADALERLPRRQAARLARSVLQRALLGHDALAGGEVLASPQAALDYVTSYAEAFPEPLARLSLHPITAQARLRQAGRVAEAARVEQLLEELLGPAVDVPERLAGAAARTIGESVGRRRADLGLLGSVRTADTWVRRNLTRDVDRQIERDALDRITSKARAPRLDADAVDRGAPIQLDPERLCTEWTRLSDAPLPVRMHRAKRLLVALLELPVGNGTILEESGEIPGIALLARFLGLPAPEAPRPGTLTVALGRIVTAIAQAFPVPDALVQHWRALEGFDTRAQVVLDRLQELNERSASLAREWLETGRVSTERWAPILRPGADVKTARTPVTRRFTAARYHYLVVATGVDRALELDGTDVLARQAWLDRHFAHADDERLARDRTREALGAAVPFTTREWQVAQQAALRHSLDLLVTKLPEQDAAEERAAFESRFELSPEAR